MFYRFVKCDEMAEQSLNDVNNKTMKLLPASLHDVTWNRYISLSYMYIYV